MEHLLKSIAYAGEEVSVVDPDFYKQRFDKFIQDLVFVPQSEKKESSESDDESSDTVEGEKTEKPATITNFASSGLVVTKADDKSEGVKVSTTAAAVIRTTKMEDKSDSAKTARKVVSPQSKENTVVNKKQK